MFTHGYRFIQQTIFKHHATNVLKIISDHWARLVIEFKNYCLKRCENCSLKSVIEIHVFSVYKTKKCVWYHGLNNMFQCSKT